MDMIAQYIPSFMLVFIRIGAFFVVAPVLSFRGVPAQFKIGLTFFIALLTFTVVGMQNELVQVDGAYLISILRETLIGLLLGFIAYLFFTVVQVAGSFVDLQMGFGIVNVIDPITGAQSPILGNFKFIIAILLFLTLNGHHYFITAMMESYQWVPINNDFFLRIYDGSVSNFVLESFTTMFVLAFKMAAPLIAALFLTDVALGMLARTAPQFNVFVIGIPIKIVIGFAVFFLMISGFFVLFYELFKTLLEALQNLLQLIGKG